MVAPIGKGLQRAGVSPDVITVGGVIMASATAVAIATGRFWLAVLFLALTGASDALDGAVAKAGGRAGPRGAYLDSVSDRLSDALLFAGCAWYLAGTDDPRRALLPFGVYIAASLVSYQRAKAESLGYQAKGGLMERAERFIVLGFGLVFHTLLVPVLWIMLVLTAITAATRFGKVWRQASGQPPRAVAAARRTRRRRTRSVADFRARADARVAARAERRRRAR
ncbi:MAG: CDP-alcohol phosphatidyltransferase family protein [Acidimicrobiales bacterium]